MSGDAISRASPSPTFCNCPAWSGLKYVAQLSVRVTAIPAVRAVRQRPRGINGGYTYG